MKIKPIYAAIAALVLIGGFAAFRPDTAFTNVEVNEAAPVTTAVSMNHEPMAVAKGMFTSGAHHTEGTAEVWNDGNAQILRLTDFETSNGPDVHVLVFDAEGKSIDLGSIKGNKGSQNYTLPAGTDAKRVQIWCKRFNVAFGEATLS